MDVAGVLCAHSPSAQSYTIMNMTVALSRFAHSFVFQMDDHRSFTGPILEFSSFSQVSEAGDTFRITKIVLDMSGGRWLAATTMADNRLDLLEYLRRL